MDRFTFFNVLHSNKYGIEYLKLIEQAREDNYVNLQVPKEQHHIYPRSFEEGTVDTEDNLVYLTVLDHILAHYYLAKAIRNQHTCYAFRMMCDLHLDKISLEDKNAILKLEECAKLRQEGRAITQEMRQHRREVALGKINISKDGKEKKVYPEEFAKEYREKGWKIGRAIKVHNPSKGKQWMHRGEKGLQVFPDKVCDYIKEGWSKGRPGQSSTKGKIRMYKNGKVRYATENTYQQMLDEGYEKGAPKGRKRVVDSQGKIHFILR